MEIEANPTPLSLQANILQATLRVDNHDRWLTQLQDRIEALEAEQVMRDLATISEDPSIAQSSKEPSTSEAVCSCYIQWGLSRKHLADCPMYKAKAGSEPPVGAPVSTEPSTTEGPSAAAEPTDHPIRQLPPQPGDPMEAALTHAERCLACRELLDQWLSWYKTRAQAAAGTILT